MRKSGKVGGFGFVLLIVVAAVVLWLAADAWKRFGSDAIAVTAPETLDASRATGAPAGVRRSDLPNLRETREATSDHADHLRDALRSID